MTLTFEVNLDMTSLISMLYI